MAIQDLGAIGEFIGGVAVVITLIYLAVQIRQNTNVHASLIRQNFYDATQQMMLHGVESSEFMELWTRAISTDDSLTPTEKTQIWRHMQAMFMGYQGFFEQYKSGSLPDKDWALLRKILTTFWLADGKGWKEAWQIMSRGRFFNEDFLDEIESLKEGAMQFRQQLEEQGLQL
jgi:hypothetical protein